MRSAGTVFRTALTLLVAGLAAGSGAGAAEGQVTGLEVKHRAGQTFLVWREVAPPEIADGASSTDVGGIRRDLAKAGIRYRIYRSEKPISSLEGLEAVGGTGPLGCWNFDYYGRGRSKGVAYRYVIEDGAEPLPPGSGLYVHNPAAAGKAYYAVTCSAKGEENRSVGPGNATPEAIVETAGQGAPVLQRTVRPEVFQFVKGATLKYYVRWEAPPNSSVENRPIDYLVAIPPAVKEPWVVGLHLHCWNGSLNSGYAWWDNNAKGAVLLASNQEPYDWWTGYNEHYFGGAGKSEREKKFKEGVVRPYSMNRTFSFLDWIASKREVDLSRTFVAGNSMGGSGAVMCAVRYGERIAFCRSWVGVHIPAETPRFKGSYEGVYGKPEWGVRFQDGTPVWDYYSDVWFMRKYPKKEIGFITFCNGKNDGAIGWPQAVKTVKAMQETRRPHLFIWGQNGHSERTVYPLTGSQNLNPIDMRVDRSLPAFTGCSLDDDIGTGTPRSKEEMDAEAQALAAGGGEAKGKKGQPDPFDGDRSGQINRWLYWETEDAVDTEDSWEMTVAMAGAAPEDSCTVDITPRRLQKLAAKAGDRFTWTNTSGGKELQKGEVAADQHGLVTLPRVKVGKAKNRVKITRE